MSCLPLCGRGTNLSQFEKKAAPVLHKFQEMKEAHTKMAHAHNQQYRAAKRLSLEHYERDEMVMAFSSALEAMRHDRQCKRLMRFVKQIGDSISKIDSVWASHAIVEGFAEISAKLHTLAPGPTSTSDEEDGGVSSSRQMINVSQNLHDGFDDLMKNLETEVCKISIVDETGVNMDDSQIEAQIQSWKSPDFQRVDPTPMHPETLLMESE